MRTNITGPTKGHDLLRKLFASRHLNSPEVAKKLGVSTQMISHYLTGRATPTMGKRWILEPLGIPPNLWDIPVPTKAYDDRNVPEARRHLISHMATVVKETYRYLRLNPPRPEFIADYNVLLEALRKLVESDDI
jgi:transcriptional regulator with XRE-family HTH domain